MCANGDAGFLRGSISRQARDPRAISRSGASRCRHPRCNRRHAMKQLVLAATAMMVITTGWVTTAHAYGDKDHPLVFNNDPDNGGDPQGQKGGYTPSAVRKPSFVNEKGGYVYLSASLSRDTIGAGPRCVVNTGGTRAAGDCDAT